MNKYQRTLLSGYSEKKVDKISFCISVKTGARVDARFSEDEDTYTIIQENDIDSTKYIAYIPVQSSIAACYYYKSREWTKVEISQYNRYNVYSMELDFNDRIEKVKFVFVNEVADDYEFKIEYQEIDKEAYQRKILEDQQKLLIENASIRHSIGADLVNIYFQPCSSDYDRTEILLYSNDQLLAKYVVDSGSFFKSINGLAYGDYAYVVTQFNSNGDILIQTDKIYFKIKRPNYGGFHVVYPS